MKKKTKQETKIEKKQKISKRRKQKLEERRIQTKQQIMAERMTFSPLKIQGGWTRSNTSQPRQNRLCRLSWRGGEGDGWLDGDYL